jgi:hypothetical protein
MKTIRILSIGLNIVSVMGILLVTGVASAQFELVNNGAVIARSDGNTNDDTAFPALVKIPDWVAAGDRADPSANYYMYYGNHGGDFIRMKWAVSINGAWTEYNYTDGTGPFPSRGVFDVGSANNDVTRDDYDHISAPDIIIDNVNQRFVMYFHGEREASSPAPRVHERFVTTSGTGLNFNDADSGGGEAGHGPIEVDVLTDNGETRDVWIGDDYMKVFQKDGRFYGVGKRGIINAAPATGNIWAQPTGNDDSAPFGESWDREDTPESNWAALTTDSDSGESQDNYYSPGATFLASQEFADHPNNPNGRRVFSNGNAERLNHVDVSLLPNDLLEVYFYVRERRSSDPDEYNGIYRFVYDVSDADFQNWTVARDVSGQVIFDVVLTPEAVSARVEESLGAGFDPTLFADPVSLGDTELFIDDDGSKYLFFSYVSDELGGAQGEGAITAVRLFILGDVNRDGSVDFSDIPSFIEVLISGDFQIEADIDQNGTVNFSDIPPFIDVLTSQ